MRATILILTCVTCSTSWCAAQAPQVAATGVISGTVKGADGTMIGSGWVNASGVLDLLKPRTKRASATAVIGLDGAFRLPAFERGRYRICVQVPGAWMNPCEWGSGGLTVELSASQPSASVNVVLGKGALVTVRVIDPGQLLLQHEGKTPGAHLLLGVGTDALFFRTGAVVSQDTGGRDYQLLIPFNRLVNISVTSAFFQLMDATGKPLARAGNVIPVLVPSGQQAPTLLLRITGVASQ